MYNVRRRDELLGNSGVRLRDCGGRCGKGAGEKGGDGDGEMQLAVCSDVIVKTDLGAVVGFVRVYIALLDECSRKWR